MFTTQLNDYRTLLTYSLDEYLNSFERYYQHLEALLRFVDTIGVIEVIYVVEDIRGCTCDSIIVKLNQAQEFYMVEDNQINKCDIAEGIIALMNSPMR